MPEESWFYIQEVKELEGVAQWVVPLITETPLVLLKGEMGSGKTTLVKYICRALGCDEQMSSPSFGIINEYVITPNNSRVYHMDLYRIRNREELLQLGIDEYISFKSPLFIEWPEILEPYLEESHLTIDIRILGNQRKIHIFHKG